MGFFEFFNAEIRSSEVRGQRTETPSFILPPYKGGGRERSDRWGLCYDLLI